MPAYNAWGSFAQQSRLPPTPPEYQTAFLTPMSAMSDQSFYSTQPYHSRHGPSSRDYSERYHQLPAYAAQQSLSAQSQRVNHLSRDYNMQAFQQSQQQQMQAQYQYGAVAAPVLPPIRVPEPIDPFPTHFSHTHPEPKPKEDKPTGGVAQHLDYDMDLMASFVAEMAQELVVGGSSPTAQFRKYVSQILSSTRLPSSTIMLGLYYLASRMKMLSTKGQSTSSSGTVYRMLTTCLLLGSKFLDDNTFQNRSWAEVSSISVQELNKMEIEWLIDFKWEIHGMMYDEDEGFFMWIEHWHAYEEKANFAKTKELHKLTPIETNIARNQSIRHQPLMSPEGPIPPQYQHGPQYDTQWVRPFISEYSPPSAPHSGPATPDYYSNTWSYSQTPSSYSRQMWNSGNTSAYGAQRNQLSSYHQPQYRPHSYSHSTWTGHGSNCGCTLCAKHPDYFFSHSGYPLQTVVG